MKQSDILVVDDEPGIVKALCRTLRFLQCAVFTANCGEAGLIVLDRYDIDLVISDLKMPGMGGLAFLKEVQLRHPYVFTIALTAYGDLETAVEAINTAGVYKFMLKPWNEQDLRTTVQRVLETRLLTMERDFLSQKVKRQVAILKNLEREHPGITQKNMDENGNILIS